MNIPFWYEVTTENLRMYSLYYFLFLFLNLYSASWIGEFFEIHNRDNVKYLAIVFEDTQSYHGRDVSFWFVF